VTDVTRRQSPTAVVPCSASLERASFEDGDGAVSERLPAAALRSPPECSKVEGVDESDDEPRDKVVEKEDAKGVTEVALAAAAAASATAATGERAASSVGGAGSRHDARERRRSKCSRVWRRRATDVLPPAATVVQRRAWPPAMGL
jgi:hypothetical protein